MRPFGNQLMALLVTALFTACGSGSGFNPDSNTDAVDDVTGDGTSDPTGDGVDDPVGDVPTECDDDDGDGVCNEDDVCEGGDDTVDTDGDTIPDFCDCEGLTCGDNAHCEDSDDGPVCVCDDGYEGDGTTCTDLDECTLGTDTCDANATCTNTDGGYDCACNAGYSGDGFTCTDDDECTLGTDTCDTNATCTNTDGGYDCACNTGYDGDGFTCTDLDECSLGTDTCDTNATCTNTDGGYTCACNTGWDGDGFTCTDIDECSLGTDTCDTNATCTNTPGAYTCACNTGYAGDGFTCTAIDHCAGGTDTCDTNATCTYTGPGTYTCACNTGYSGDGFTCTAIDHCTAGTDTCDTNATCTYTGPGTYTCACNTGYSGDGFTCAPIDHCTAGTDTCDTNATCTFTGPGTYDCECNPGYVGDGFTCTDAPDIGCDVYNHDFATGHLPDTSVQCTDWVAFKAGLETVGYTSLEMTGSSDTTRAATCSNPTMVQEMADALRAGATGTWSCDGTTFHVGLCVGDYTISAGHSSHCSCTSPYAMRPCVDNSNWGGMGGTGTCGQTTQNMTVKFCRGNCINYQDHFPTGVLSSSSSQCSDWNGWRGSLPTSGMSTVTMWGSADITGVTCAVPGTVQTMANAMRTGTVGAWSCGGRSWEVGECGTASWTLSASGSDCGCPDPGYIARPCINNQNWGGMDTDTCDSPTQEMAVEFCGGVSGTVRKTDGTWHPVTFTPCGSGAPGTCTGAAAKASCTAIGAKVASHASNGTTEVESLGATSSCNWSTSYFTVDGTMPSGSCLVGISNLDWTSCCGVGSWHGNTIAFGSAGTVFGRVDTGNSGYVAAYPNVDGQHWSCRVESTLPTNLSGCTTQYVACTW